MQNEDENNGENILQHFSKDESISHLRPSLHYIIVTVKMWVEWYYDVTEPLILCISVFIFQIRYDNGHHKLFKIQD